MFSKQTMLFVIRRRYTHFVSAGTTQTRGQIPHILYYSNPQDSDWQHTSKAMVEVQARKCALAMTATIIQRSNEIFALARERAEEVVAAEVLGNATFVTTLLPLVMAHISPLATSDPRVTFRIPAYLYTKRYIISHADLNKLSFVLERGSGSHVNTRNVAARRGTEFIIHNGIIRGVSRKRSSVPCLCADYY